jgi:hypothetical protein
MKIYRPITVTIGVVLVLLAGLVRLGDPERALEDHTRTVKSAAIGEQLAGDDFTLEVHRVRFAREYGYENLTSDERPATTDGVFAVLEYSITGRHAKGSIGSATLRSASGVTYEPHDLNPRTSLYIPEPGFTETYYMVFEVNPDDLAGLTLRLERSQLFTVLATDYHVDLGIRDAAAGHELADKAAELYEGQEAKVFVKS